MAIFKNAKWDKFIDTDNFPIITMNWSKLVCPICKKQICCNVKECNCWYEKLTLNDAYIFQKKEIRDTQRTKLLQIRKEKGEWFDADWKMLIYQADECPNPNCTNHAYYCRNWCITDNSFDMSPYTITNKQF